jgi:hypothetical protein
VTTLTKPIRVLRYTSFILLTALFFAGCKNRKSVGDCTTPLLQLNKDVNEKISEHLADFEDITLRVKANYKGGNNDQSFGMTIKMKKDSFIWASVNVMLEVARAYVTPDSFKLIDRINRKYYVGSVDQFEQFTGQKLTLSQLQNLLLANPVYAVEGFQKMHDDLRNDFLQQTQSGIINKMQVTACYRPGTTEFSTHQSERSFVVDYKNFNPVKKVGQLPSQLEVTASDKANKYQLMMDYTSVTTEPLAPIRFTIPSKYEKG